MPSGQMDMVNVSVNASQKFLSKQVFSIPTSNMSVYQGVITVTVTQIGPDGQTPAMSSIFLPVSVMTPTVQFAFWTDSLAPFIP
jgi:hypothetical protein